MSAASPKALIRATPHISVAQQGGRVTWEIDRVIPANLEVGVMAVSAGRFGPPPPTNLACVVMMPSIEYENYDVMITTRTGDVARISAQPSTYFPSFFGFNLDVYMASTMVIGMDTVVVTPISQFTIVFY